MSLFPDHRQQAGDPFFGVILPDSMESNGAELPGIIGQALYGTSAWPVAKRVVYFPFTTSRQLEVTNMFWNCGAGGTDQAQAGIYSWDGTLLAATSAAANVAGLNQRACVVTLGPGSYHLALTNNGTTDTFARRSYTVEHYRCLGVTEETTGAFGLPALATFNAFSVNGLGPFIGLTTLPGGI